MVEPEWNVNGKKNQRNQLSVAQHAMELDDDNDAQKPNKSKSRSRKTNNNKNKKSKKSSKNKNKTKQELDPYVLRERVMTTYQMTLIYNKRAWNVLQPYVTFTDVFFHFYINIFLI